MIPRKQHSGKSKIIDSKKDHWLPRVRGKGGMNRLSTEGF